jgi:drug/metabolite transporter (DMT)-like permease
MEIVAKSLNRANQADQAAQERSGQWLLVMGGVLLGTIGVFVEEAGQHPLITVWFRCIFGALALLFWGFAMNRSKELRLHGRDFWVAVVTGVLMVVNWGFFFAAISRTSIAVATVVFHIQPFWVMIFGLWFLRERVSPAQWAAVLLALGGLILATGLSFEDFRVGTIDDEYVIGLMMCLVGSLSYAAVTIIAKTERRMTSFALAWWQCTVGAVVLAWVPLAYGWPNQTSAWPWLVGLGVVHTGLAYAILFAGMAKLSLAKVGLLQFIYPLTAVAVDWMIYGRVLDSTQLAGVGLMAIALWTIKISGG